jgi:hypothetical protein
LFRDTTAGVLGAIAGNIVGGTYGSLAGGGAATMMIPAAICLQQICL